jgi:outer membrane receptor protein involved in Fe transport
LYRQFSSSGFFAFMGNPRLTPEKSTSYAGGWTFTKSRVRYSANVFYNRFKNGIGFFQVTEDDPIDPFFLPFLEMASPAPLYTNHNLGDYDARGVNSMLDVLLPYGFTATFNYTFLDRVRVSDGEDNGERMVGLGNVRNAAFLKFGWTEDFRVGSSTWSFNTNVRSTMRGREPLGTTSRFDRPADLSRGGQIEYVRAYDTWDWLISLQIPLGERVRIRPYFAINNLANYIPMGLEYDDGGSVDNRGDTPTSVVFREPGRTYRGGISFRF